MTYQPVTTYEYQWVPSNTGWEANSDPWAANTSSFSSGSYQRVPVTTYQWVNEPYQKYNLQTDIWHEKAWTDDRWKNQLLPAANKTASTKISDFVNDRLALGDDQKYSDIIRRGVDALNPGAWQDIVKSTLFSNRGSAAEGLMSKLSNGMFSMDAPSKPRLPRGVASRQLQGNRSGRTR